MTRHGFQSLVLGCLTLLATSCGPHDPALPAQSAAAPAAPSLSQDDIAKPANAANVVKPAADGGPALFKLGSATMTGPIYEQDCDALIGEAASTPNWCQHSGFDFVDTTGSGAVGVPRYYVQSGDVNLQLDTTFVDDTTKMEQWIPLPIDGSANSDTFNCAVDNSGLVHCGGLVPWVYSKYEGNEGVYKLAVQEWRPFCGGVKTPNCLDQDPNTYKCDPPLTSMDPQQPAIVFNNSPDGSNGCWTSAASFTNTLHGSSLGAPGATIAPRDGSVTSSLGGVVHLPQVATYVRAIVTVQLNDTRTGEAPPMWDNKKDMYCWDGQWSDNCICDPTGNGPPWCRPEFWGPEWHQHPETGGFYYAKAFNPFQLVVMPVALAQLKVMPYTIVYQPPGDFSQATFRVSTSYAVTMTAGSSTTNSNSTTVDLSGSVGESLGISGGPKGGTGLDGFIGGTFNLTSSTANKWDHSTTLGVGRSSTTGSGASATFSDTYKWTLSDSTQTPGVAGSYDHEPFWDDQFVFVVHPQYAFWTDVGGHPSVTLLGALGTPQNPDWFELSVRALDACYRQTPGSGYENGIVIPDTNGELLTKDDCYQFLQLDPFWTVGQSIPSLTDLSLSNDPRFQFLTATDYGVPHACAVGPQPCGSDVNFTLDELNTISTTQSGGTGTTFSSAISDIIASSSSQGFSGGIFGIVGGGTFQSGETTTTTAKMDFTLTESVSATSQQSTELIGVLDDHHGLASDKGPSGTGTKYLPDTARTYIYKDKLFGSFLYQDKAAPLGAAFELRLSSSSVSVQANHGFAVDLTALATNSTAPSPVSLNVALPTGVTARASNPSVVSPGQTVTLGFLLAPNAPLGNATITITGTSSDQLSQVMTISLTTQACVPAAAPCSSVACGPTDDGCGNPLFCDTCPTHDICLQGDPGTGWACVYVSGNGPCIPTPRHPCPE